MENFIEKTINDIQKIFEDFYYADLNGSQKRFMGTLDPRVKLITAFLLIVLVNLCTNFYGLGLFFLYTIVLVLISKINYKKYILRVSAVSVLFGGIVLIPSLFNVVSEGNAFLHFSRGLYITKEGVNRAVFFITRSFISLSAVYVVAITTRWLDIMKALRYLKIPDVFASALEMTQRYIFLFLESASNMFLARKSRTVKKTSSAEGRRFVANSIGYLILKSGDLTDEIYNAMIARGYHGEIKTINRFALKKQDYLWLIFNMIFFIIVAVRGGIF